MTYSLDDDLIYSPTKLAVDQGRTDRHQITYYDEKFVFTAHILRQII